MYVKFTNANPEHRGNPIAIRKDLIATIYPSTIERANGVTEQVTFVFCPPHGAWEVEESFEEVIDMLSGYTL